MPEPQAYTLSLADIEALLALRPSYTAAYAAAAAEQAAWAASLRQPPQEPQD